jgi:hypothetical protein
MRVRSESHKGTCTESCGNTEEELRKFEQINAKTFVDKEESRNPYTMTVPTIRAA